MEEPRRVVRWEHFHNLDNGFHHNHNESGDFSTEEDMEENTDVKILPIAITPAGPMPMSVESLTSSFNLWILHANFKFTKGDIKTICDVDGIEAVTIFSRYRLRILIGEMFDAEEVMYNVEESLGCEINFSKDIELTEELLNRIDLIRKKFQKGEHFLIYALPNGQLKSFSSKELGKELANQINLFEKTYEAVGGYLVISSTLMQ